MEKRNEADKIDEVVPPGFRFHPTDEELVGFYLTRKIQQQPLSIQLIRQIDIYKYDPWDLPKLATNGEKEWYFYCPRDRKYRNGTRPNRVTGAGFWKATGTDRPIYSCESSKCIGLKKSLVFYRGKAAKGIKTDWMMHEFRLPSVSHSVSPNQNIPANEAWSICRIFKKAYNSSTNRAVSHSWVSPFLDTTKSADITNPVSAVNNIQFTYSTITMANNTISPLQFGFCNDIERSSMASFSPHQFPHMENNTCPVPMLNGDHLNPCYTFPSIETPRPASRCVANDASSLLLELSTSILGDSGKSSENMDDSIFHEHFNDLSATMPEDVRENPCYGEETVLVKGQSVGQIDEQWGETIRSMEFPCSFPLSLPHAWKSNLM